MKSVNVRKLVLAALFLALALVLPLLTGQIRQIGKMLCPMHIPVLLCGFLCGWPYALAVGLIAPVMRSAIFAMPIMYPSAVCMSVELASYGVISAILYRVLPKKKSSVFIALLTAMVFGRLIWGAARYLCAGLSATEFGFAAFWAGAVTEAIPGIILQLILVPVIVMAVDRQRKAG